MTDKKELETQARALEVVKTGIANRMGDIKALVPKGTIPERFARSAYIAIARDPQLQLCEPASLVLRVLEAAQVGLSLDRTMQEAVLLARWNSKKQCHEAQLMPEYKGLLRLAQQHGSIDHVDVVEVNEKDRFAMTRGSKPEIVHVPCLDADPGAPVGYYAIAFFKSGTPKFEYMNMRQIEAVRAKVRGSDKPDSPWMNWFGEMAKKTVLKRLLKTVPRTEHAAGAIAADDLINEDPEELELTVEATPFTAERQVQKPEREPAHEPARELEVVEEAKPAATPAQAVVDAKPEPAADPDEDAEHLAQAQREAELAATEFFDGTPEEKRQTEQYLQKIANGGRAIDDGEQALVRAILKQEKVTQVTAGRKWLKKVTGREVQRLSDLTVAEIVPLLKKYYPERVQRYLTNAPEQEEML